MEHMQEQDLANVMDTIKMQDERQVTFATPDVTLRSRKRSFHQNGVSSDEENTRRGMSERARSEIQASELKQKSQSQRDLGLYSRPPAAISRNNTRPITESPKVPLRQEDSQE